MDALGGFHPVEQGVAGASWLSSDVIVLLNGKATRTDVVDPNAGRLYLSPEGCPWLTGGRCVGMARGVTLAQL